MLPVSRQRPEETLTLEESKTLKRARSTVSLMYHDPMSGKRAPLLTRVQRELSDSMVGAGWHASGEEMVTDTCAGEFVCELRDDYVAVAFFPWFGDQGSSAAVNVLARIGLQYRPAQRLLASFTGSPVRGLVLRRRAERVRVSAEGEIRDAVQRLVEFTCEQTAMLDALTEIDRLIETLREHDAVPYVKAMMPVYARDVTDDDRGEPAYPSSEDELVPALLVAAGRYDEARRLLNKSQSNESCHRRRFVRQLSRVIDGRGGLNYPATPPEWPVSRVDRPMAGGNREKVGRAVRQLRAERQALDAVRAVRKNDTRDRLRQLLEAEFEARHLHVSAADVADMVNVLYVEQERGGTLKLLRSVVKDVGHLVASISNVPSVACDGDDDLLSPAWRALPDRAGYPIWPTRDKWVDVELDDHAGEWLMRELQSPSPARQEIMVWFAWVDERDLGLKQLGVHVGSTRVGTLTSSYGRFFVKPVEAAAERDEDPWTRARLRVVSPDQPPVLEVGIPAIMS